MLLAVAGRDRRPARRPAHAVAAHVRARAPDRAAARRRSPRTTSRARRPTARRSRYDQRPPRRGERMSVGEAVPTGNTFDKYGSTNPVVRRLMAGFEGTLDRLFERAAPQSVLDVGCGEGVLTYRWAQRLGDAPGRRPRPRGPQAARRMGRRAGATTSSSATMPAGPPAVRRRRIRPRHGDRGARARARSRADGRRDGARGPPPPARVGAARAAVARAEHGARRIPARPRQHAGPRQPLHEARVCVHCWRGTARSSRSVRRFRGRCCWSASADDVPTSRRRDARRP